MNLDRNFGAESVIGIPVAQVGANIEVDVQRIDCVLCDSLYERSMKRVKERIIMDVPALFGPS
jgi:hypothetical protein